MSTDQDNLLAARFAALAPEPLTADWDEVLDRAGAATVWDDVLARAGVAPVAGPQQATTRWLPRGHRRWVIVAFALVVVGVVVVGSALATHGYDSLRSHSVAAGHRPGSLDTSFGRGGKVTTSIGSGVDVARALAIQQDGKLVAAGTNNTGPIDGGGYNRFALVRYHANGTLDGSFGGGGKVTTPISTGDVVVSADGNSGVFDVDDAYALAIQQDGKLVAAGQAGGGRGHWGSLFGDFALVRYNANGKLDTSFGRGGKVTTPLGGVDVGSGARSLAIQKDGKLVAAGFNWGGGGYALVRYHANGSLDTSFGRGGKVTTPGAAYTLAIQKDGKLVAAGAGDNGFTLARYNANGTLDTSFGRGGIVRTTIGSGGSEAFALVIQRDGKLVAAGSRNNNDGTNGVFVLVRYNANGTLDRSFGRGGKVTTPTGGASALAIQQDGKLVAFGGALVRYNANGTLDRSFGRGGVVTTPTGSASALVIQQDGKLVAAGSSDNGFALVRYWP